MDLKEINKKIKELDLPEKQKEGILELIDVKINEDMEKVLNAISLLKSETNANIGALKSESNANIGALKSETSLIKWLIGGIATLILWSIFKK